MKKEKKYIRYGKERAILSDVLPYEAPLIFSNRHLYKFLVKNKIELSDGKIQFIGDHPGTTDKCFAQILKLLFGVDQVDSNSAHVSDRHLRTIPFNYKIAHKDTDFRVLTVIHPLNQIDLVRFYDRYKEQILYYCKVSKFSIRRPDSVAKFMYFNDKLHVINRGAADDFIELRGKEYENLRSFFAYKKYTNIHRFYEDYRYQRAEKKYKILHKFDITKCFDSIYTHSLSWALINKEIVKDHLFDGKAKSTFSGKFDQFIQNSNYGETNGIIIGPEFSRIFAELILQKIDKTVENHLRSNCELYHRKDYELYRYVDDYFLFCDHESTKEIILRTFRHELKEYRMSFNDLKSKAYTKPMITEISIAKQKINQLFEKEPRFKIEETDKENKEVSADEEEITVINKHVFKIYINPNKLALKFKTIVKDSGVEYKDILNYSLAILNSKIEDILEKFDSRFKKYCEEEHKGQMKDEDLAKKKKLENKFTKFIVGYLDFVFFLYSVSPRVNSSIKLTHILSKVIMHYKGCYKISLPDGTPRRKNKMTEMNRDLVFKKISDDCSLILERHQMDKHTQVEELYLLIVLRELGKNYRINQNQLARYFNFWNKKENKIEANANLDLNYFSITVLLFYIKDVAIYNDFKQEIKTYTIRFITDIDTAKRKKSAESVLLALDLIVCPYLPNDFKKEILALFDVPQNLVTGTISFRNVQKYWFTKWENFNLLKELNSKNSEEVYS